MAISFLFYRRAVTNWMTLRWRRWRRGWISRRWRRGWISQRHAFERFSAGRPRFPFLLTVVVRLRKRAFPRPSRSVLPARRRRVGNTFKYPLTDRVIAKISTSENCVWSSYFRYIFSFFSFIFFCRDS